MSEQLNRIVQELLIDIPPLPQRDQFVQQDRVAHQGGGLDFHRAVRFGCQRASEGRKHPSVSTSRQAHECLPTSVVIVIS